MKAIMKTIKPKQCLNIMNHKQSILVIKDKKTATAIQKLIDENEYADIYVCCSKINRKHYHLLEVVDTDTDKTEYEIDYFIGGTDDYLDYCYESKVAFKFRCYKVNEFLLENLDDYNNDDIFIPGSCLTVEEMRNYFNHILGEDGYGYAIHINDLEIFDMPKELSEFQGTCNRCEAFRLKVCKLNPKKCDRHLKKAPKNFCYVEVEE